MNQPALRAAAQQRAIAPMPIGGFVRAQENASHVSIGMVMRHRTA